MTIRKKVILLFVLFFAFVANAQEKRQLIIDADTGNEVDDLFAITRAVLEPSWHILALNSTQWQVSQWAVEHTMENSYRLNVALLSHWPDNTIKICRGSQNRLFDWGNKAQHSEAAYEIINQAHKTGDGKKLPVVTLGALTNVASAILIDPEIESKIVVYWLGTSYDFERNTSKRIDFNAVMDIQAVDIMLTSSVEMHIIPVNVASAMKFRFAEMKKQMEGKHPACDFLIKRWDDHFDSSRAERTLWDLGLIQAMIYPEKSTEVLVDCFENKNVWLYSHIDFPFFKEDFFNSISTLWR